MQAAFVSAVAQACTMELPCAVFRQSVKQAPVVQGYLASRQSIIASHFVSSDVLLSLHALHGIAGGYA
jgi:hypothetical protein